MQFNFEWDPDKAKRNQRRHKVSFERATQVFLDPNMLSLFDEEHSETEERWITIGVDGNGVPLVVVHTFKELNDETVLIRIISSRKATKVEQKQYSQR
ncbi:MAG: BrnT family toxin [Bacteroidota bacterium]